MRYGYSYIQVLVVIAIMVILAGVASPYYIQWQNRERLQSATDTLLADLWLTQTKAMQRQFDAPWGIQFNDALKRYVIFHGATYVSSDPYNIVVDYPHTVTIASQPDILFSAVTGALTTGTSTTITLTTSSLPNESRSITIYAQGTIIYN